MPLKLSRSDRRLLMWAALVFLPMIIALALLSTTDRDSGVPSTYSNQPSGAKAAYILLQDLGYTQKRWDQSPVELPNKAAGTVLILAGPTTSPSEEERSALKLYLSRGGRILATGGTVDVYLPEAQTTPEFAPAQLPRDFKPQLVTVLTRSGAIRMSPAAFWKDCNTRCLTHYADDDRPIVVSYSVGEGQVIWWASSMPLSNGAIKNDGNLGLFLNSLGPPSGTRVLWDEYFHSSRRTIGSYIFDRPVLFAMGQLALLALALLLAYSRRNGPIHPADEPSRLSPLEFVETVGGLYQRAHAVRAALEVPYNRFRAGIIRQLGLKSEISAAELARAVQSRLGMKDDHLEDLLQRIEAALYDPGLAESEALELVQKLNFQTRRLRLVPAAR